MNGALGRGAVVTRQINYQGVIETLHLGQTIDQPFNLGVCVGQKARENFHQAGRHRLIAIGVVIPGGYLLWALGEHGIRGDYPSG